MAMPYLLDYNITETLVIVFSFFFQAYCFHLRDAALAEGIKAPSHSLRIRCQSTYREAVQNHTMVEVGMDLWDVIVSSPLLKQGHLEPVAWDPIQTASRSLQQ